MIVPVALPVGAVGLIDQVLPIAPGEEKRAHHARLFEHRQLGFYLLHGKIWKDEAADRVFVFPGGKIAVYADSPAQVAAPPLDIALILDMRQLSGAQPHADGKAVGMDIPVRALFAAVYRSGI